MKAAGILPIHSRHAFLSSLWFPDFSLTKQTQFPQVDSLCDERHETLVSSSLLKANIKGRTDLIKAPPVIYSILWVLFSRLLNSIKPGLVRKINRLPTPIAGLVSLAHPLLRTKRHSHTFSSMILSEIISLFFFLSLPHVPFIQFSIKNAVKLSF